MTENGWGQERKINGEPATPILVAGGEGGEAKSSANGCLIKLYFIHLTSPFTVAPDIHVIQVVNPHLVQVHFVSSFQASNL